MEAWRQLQAVIDRIVAVAFERGVETLSSAERDVLLVWSYSGAVDNGGHASFFYNSYGENAHETVEALTRVGALAYTQILRRAIALFPTDHIPRDIEARNQAMDALPDQAKIEPENLDREFSSLRSDRLLE